jgi:hypothetical protein
MNKIEITVRVNLIHSKLVFQKQNYCSREREQCECIYNSLHWFF